MDTYESLMAQIEGYDVVSFDVFDTLLLRPYVKPTDLFFHVEKDKCRPGFACERIMAEKRARTKERPEPFLDQIYEEMPPEFFDMKDSELIYEKTLLRANPGMVHVYRNAIERGKRVLLISDMYLPSSFVTAVLEKNGLVGHEALFMSCEYGVSKHSGKLFLEVLGSLNVSPDEIIHVGDNRHSDVESPRKLGIATAPYTRPIDRYFENNPRERKFYKSNKGLDASIIVSMDMLRRLTSVEKKDYWYTLGYRYGGPVNLAFARFVEDSTNEGKLLFVARDGFKPKLVYDKLYGKKETAYVYAPRMQGILSNTTGRDYPGFEKDIEERFADMGPYGENRDAYEKIMQSEMEAYGTYVKGIVEDDRAYIVDATTRKFTAQRLISAALGRDIDGIYFVMLRSRGETMPYSAFKDRLRMWMSLTPVDFPEFLMASSEAPVLWVDGGEPIYSDEISEQEEFRMEVSKKVEGGVLDYVDDVMHVFGDLTPHIGSKSIFAWIRAFEKTQLPEDNENMSRLKWSSDPRHSKYHGMIFSPRDAPSLLWVKVKGLYESLVARIG